MRNSRAVLVSLASERQQLANDRIIQMRALKCENKLIQATTMTTIIDV
jgi:hypothetical protein